MNILKILLFPLTFNTFTFWQAAVDAFLPALGKGAAAVGLGKLFGPSQGSLKRERRQEQKYTTEQMVLGNELDLQNQKDMFDFRMGRARGAGLTNVEAFGSPAAGAGGGTTGSGQTLGNAASSQAIADRQIDKDHKLAWQKTVADNMTALQQTKMQTDAQKDVAETQVGATTRGQDIQKEIADRDFNLRRDQYLNVTLPEAAANIGKTKQETRKLINETATSDKKFVTAMKQLSMGPANLLVELTMRHHGIALNDNSFKALPKQDREAILGQILALSSKAYTEGKGAAALGKGAVEGGESILDSIMSIISNPVGTHKGIEAAPSLGRPQSSSSEPHATGPNMRYR